MDKLWYIKVINLKGIKKPITQLWIQDPDGNWVEVCDCYEPDDDDYVTQKVIWTLGTQSKK